MKQSHSLKQAVGGELFARGRFVVLLSIVLCCAILMRYGATLGQSLLCALVFVPFFFWKKNRMRAVALCTMWIVGVLACCHAMLPLEEAMQTQERRVEISAIVSSVDTQEGCMTLSDVTIDGEPRRGEITYWADAQEVLPEVFSRISCTCDLHVKNVFGNAGNDYTVINNTRYNNWIYVSNGENLQTESAQLSLVQSLRFGMDQFFTQLRNDIRQSVFENVTDQHAAALCYGMLVGDSSYVEDETYTVYRDGGILHLLAVSGLHIGMIAAAIAFVFKKLPLPLWLRSILCIGVIGFYVLLCDVPISARRAVIIFVITQFAPQLRRRADPMCSLATALIVILLFDPLALFNIGLRLSFCATGTIVLLAKDMGKGVLERLADKHVRFIKPIRNFLSVTITAQLGVLPCLLATYGEAPLSSFLINPIVVPFAGVLLGSSWLTVAADMLGIYPALFGKMTMLLFQCVTEFTRMANGILPKLVLPVWCAPMLRVLFFVLLFSLSSFCLLHKRYKRIFSGLLAISLVSVYAVHIVRDKQQDRITMLDVGQGQCVLVQVDGENILLDCGTAEYGGISANGISSALIRMGAAHIDGIILSHNDSDHINRAVELSHLLTVEEIICNHTYSAEFDGANCSVVTPQESALSTWKDGTIRILAGKGAGENEDSYIIDVQLDELSILVMGDATKESEARLLRDGLEDYDVLIVGHHGSNTASSKEFLSACGAEIALISAGRGNFYGHPDEAVLRLLEKQNMDTYCTAECGMIQIDEDGQMFTYYPDGYPFERGGQEF